MTSIKDLWNKLTSWTTITANNIVSANVSPVIDTVEETAKKVEETVRDVLSHSVPNVPKKNEPQKFGFDPSNTDPAAPPVSMESPKKKRGRKKKSK